MLLHTDAREVEENRHADNTKPVCNPQTMLALKYAE